jgi:hypothetical protein
MTATSWASASGDWEGLILVVGGFMGGHLGNGRRAR